VTVAPPPPAPRDDGRLPPTAKPLHYGLALRIDPAKEGFSGVATIDVDVPAETSYLVLNARDLRVTRAVVHAGGRDFPAAADMRLGHGGVVPEELVLGFAQPVPAGSAVVEIAYDAPFAKDLAGLYRVQEEGRWYAYTQFEATDARRAFPCFDEPGFKTPYDVTITAPVGTIALTNSPETSHADVPGAMVEHHFEKTPPLPSYLVAFAVGDFDIVEGQKEPFPIRVVTTKGRSGMTAMALDEAAAFIAKLAEYFDIPYPYRKLDLVAVPDFGPGAMENAGLVTFRDVLVLVDPRTATTATRRLQALVIAHELAHQWFGDLVTMKWWDDIWLNEGFATWAEAKVVDAWKPAFGATAEAIAGMQAIMDTDALKTSRAVRQPVGSTSDAMEIDLIVYDKAAGILRMIESFLGPDIFRRGVQHYLGENAWKNASATDLFAAIDYVSAEHVAPLADAFLEHSGVPDVLVSWKCKGDGARVELRESEWRPLGGEGGDRPRTWKLPICWSSDGQKAKTCFTLGAEPIARDVNRCPTWLYPNADGAGYYRYVLEAPQFAQLVRSARALKPVERMGLVSNAWAAVRQGAIAPGVFLDALPEFDRDSDPYVVEQIAGALRDLGGALVDDAARPAFRRYVAARMAARKARLGWEASAARPAGAASANEDDRALERKVVLRTLGEVARDKATLADAEKYTQRWLADPSGVPGDVAAVAVPAASLLAGEGRLEELRKAAKNAQTPEQRLIAVRAMGMFEDGDVLRKALDLALTDELRLSELRYLFGAVQSRPEAAPVLYAWEKEKWPKLAERLPGSFGRGMLVDVAANLCTEPAREDARAFFTQATHGIEGIQRDLDQSLERAGLCIALRTRFAGEVTGYFKKR
jgi:aminopeptidase N